MDIINYILTDGVKYLVVTGVILITSIFSMILNKIRFSVDDNINVYDYVRKIMEQAEKIKVDGKEREKYVLNSVTRYAKKNNLKISVRFIKKIIDMFMSVANNINKR